jgi:eukaryotic-like serine/threonine-protein kinase
MTEPEATEIPVHEGDVIAGKYRVERVLGVGGMGIVVSAMHAELDQRVAIKVLLPAAAKNPAVIARFSREARAAAKIKSEHVVRVSDVGSLDSGLPFIVMEHLDGQDLSQILETQGKFLPGKAVDHVLQACEALAEAHAAGFVHRDLKPGNLFLARQPDGSEIVKVLDFGISKAAISDEDAASAKPGSLTRTTDVFGSPLYMSPEQLKSSRDVDARADIWALGVILYELIGGKPPFDRPTIAETFGAILYEKAPSLASEGVAADLSAVVLRCLEKDAAARYANVAELAKALLPFAEHATRHSVDRASRVLKRAGVTIDTLPPPPSATASTSPGASTRTSWNADEGVPGVPRRSGSGRASIVAGVGLSVALGVGVWLAFLRPGAPSPQPPARAAVSAEPTAPTALAPTAVETAAPAPSVSASAAETASAPSASASVSATATVAVVPGPPATQRAVAKPPAAPIPPPPPEVTVTAPPKPPPVKPPEDPNGFGDRK